MNKDLDDILDCISYHLDDPSSLSQALETIAKMCTGSDVMKNQLRASKGLGLIQNVLTSTENYKVKTAAMYCLGCAVEKNVFSQRELCNLSMFSILHDTLTVSDPSEKTKQASLFLTICLVANCDMGQLLVRKSGCLWILLQLFTSAFPSDLALEAKEKDILGMVDNGDSTDGRDLWCTVTQALCMCVNNPKNEKNQLMCADVFPTAFQYLKSCFETRIVRPLTSFIALSVAENAANKEAVYKCQGLNTLLCALSKAVDEEKDVENIICYTTALDAAIMDSRRNAEVCGRLGILGILWTLLNEWDLTLSAKTKLVLTLHHCTENTERNQLEWVELGGRDLLVGLLTQSSDEELSNTVKYILQCISRDAHVSSRRSSSVTGCTSLGCSLYERDSSAADKGHTCNDLAKKFELFEQQTIKRFEQLQAIRTPLQTQTMQMATSSKTGERIQECHQAMSARSGRNVTNKRVSIVESTSEKTCQHESSQPRVQKRHPMTERTLMKNRPTEAEIAPKNYVQCSNKEFQQNQSCQNERTDTRWEAMPSRSNASHSFCRNGESAIAEQEEVKEMEEEGYEIEEEAEYEDVEGGEEEEKDYEEEEDDDITICAVNSEDGNTREISEEFAVTNMLKENSRSLPLHSQHVSPKLCANSSRLETDRSKMKSCCVFQCESQENTHAKLPMEQVSPNSTLGFKRPVGAPLRNNPTQPQSRRSVLQVIPPPSPCQSEFDSELVVAADRRRGQRVLLTPNYLNEEPGFSTMPCVVANNACSFKHGRNRGWSPYHGSSITSSGDSCKTYLPEDSSNAFQVQHDNDICFIRHRNTVSSPMHNNNAYSPDRDHVSFGNLEKVNRFSTEPSLSRSCSRQREVFPRRTITSTVGRKEESTPCSSSTAAFGDDGKRNRCPGCHPPSELGIRRLLNSRTFSIAFENNDFSCSIHRYVRDLERSFAAALKRKVKAELHGLRRSHLLRRESALCFRTGSTCQTSEDVYEFNESSDSLMISSPEDVADCESGHERTSVSGSKFSTPSKARRGRVPYSQTEEENLIAGVDKFGNSWTQILCSYEFHPCRTAVDLKEKFQRMKKSSAVHNPSNPSLFSSASATPCRHLPLSMAEERRLRRGVHIYGHNWTAILDNFCFARGRKAEELRDSWKSMHSSRNKSCGSVR